MAGQLRFRAQIGRLYDPGLGNRHADGICGDVVNVAFVVELLLLGVQERAFVVGGGFEQIEDDADDGAQLRDPGQAGVVGADVDVHGQQGGQLDKCGCEVVHDELPKIRTTPGGRQARNMVDQQVHGCSRGLE
ncbi:hypothetical protein [Ancrocorticia populi]|uniref:hypothetical protein n=1 Tax=Ancrocorticia populi TaxID=2175228 RepID=UPI003F91D6A6